MPRSSRGRFVATLGALVLGFTTVAVVWAAGPNPDPRTLALFRTPNTDFPDVAMRVDGQSISGQYLSYAIQALKESDPVAQSLTRPQLVAKVVDRLTVSAAMAAEASKRGFAASADEVTEYLTTQTNGMVADFPEQAAAVWAANGDADASAYIADPNVRHLAARMIAGSKMLAALRSADPSFDDLAFANQIKSGIKVELFFKP